MSDFGEHTLNTSAPAGWKVVPLGHALEKVVGGGTPARSNPGYWKGSIPWLTVKDMRTRRPADSMDHINEDAVENSSTNIIPADTVIIATRIGLGKVIRVPFPAAINQDLKALIPKDGIDKNYLEYWIYSIASYLESIGSGTTVKGIRLEQLKSLPFPIAPLDQQVRIVAEIEKQFSRLDEAVANLKRVKANLKRYKAAVLKAAVEGKLTEEWRKQNPDVEPASKLLERISEARNAWIEQKISEGSGEAKRLAAKIKKHTFDAPEDISLPDSWVWASLLTTSLIVVDCHNKTAPYEESGIPLVRTTNVRDGRLILETAKYVSHGTYEYWSRRCPPEPGDILFTREAPMGEAAIIPDGVTLCMGQRMMLIRPPAGLVDNTFILDWFMSPVFQERFGAGAVGMGVKHLRVGDVERLFVPLPPIGEQREIVAITDQQLSVISSQLAELNRAMAHAQRLRQSTLAAYFSGRLS